MNLLILHESGLPYLVHVSLPLTDYAVPGTQSLRPGCERPHGMIRHAGSHPERILCIDAAPSLGGLRPLVEALLPRRPLRLAALGGRTKKSTRTTTLGGASANIPPRPNILRASSISNLFTMGQVERFYGIVQRRLANPFRICAVGAF